MTNAKTMQQFIAGIKNEGQNSTGSIYFVGDVCYSYGSHYPIGIKYNDYLIVNCTSYSNSTAKHRNQLLSSYYGGIINAPTDAMVQLANNTLTTFKDLAVKHHKEALSTAELKVTRARSKDMINFRLDEVAEAKEQIKAIESLNFEEIK